ncbi:hypothetical protein A4H97_20420 [Niastella yeongjuensis]|uniref:Uncharacterized protein n=2 Tax=Niastella yeongjuensis TaxID=354355 RepID=A0A1V9FC47_9BACT|nr:hypothetical protein A4H97_20420 [Niastella yeongjuensis]SEP26275.1 hypothetical protein SAMN05660816_04991 [Niastella yeongjuensis]
MKKTIFPRLLPAIAIFFCTVSILPGCDNVDNDVILKQDGVKALGTLKDGTGESGKYSEYFDVIVEYTDENGTSLTVHKSVTRSDFKSFSKDQQVMLVYSRKNPAIIKLLLTPEEILEYTGIKERDMEIADLNALVTMKKENMDSSLNKITFGWVKNNDTAWINERKNQYIRVFPHEKSIIYIAKSPEYKRFYDLAKQAGYRSVTEGKEGSDLRIFENDSLIIDLNLNRSTRERDISPGNVPIPIKEEVQLSVVTLSKKQPAKK